MRVKCNFCGTDMAKGIGILHAYRDGTVYSFCSRKCETNMLKLKRKPQKVKWTARYHEEKAIRMHGKEKKEKAVKKEQVKAKTTRAERKAKREEKKKAIKAKKKAMRKGAKPKKAEKKAGVSAPKAATPQKAKKGAE
ncbi:MAG: hypothetical protein KAW41_05310 [Candidatus Diapherotrites archaeon]|nr:hypothetical protein [Candidatus Diapherotrites archaeon]